MTAIDDIRLVDDKFLVNNELKWLENTIQHFIFTYRMISGDTDTFNPQYTDFHQIEISEVLSSRREGQENVLNLKPFHVITPRSTYFNRTPFKTTLNEENEKRFRESLRNPESYTLTARLLLESEENMHIRNDYVTPIVISLTACETGIQYLLHRTCDRLGVTSLPQRDGKPINCKDAIDRGNVREDLLRYVDHLSGKHIKNSPRYQHWFRLAYKPRLDIIHRGDRGYSKKAAQNAI
jgi:hypothetical protein